MIRTQLKAVGVFDVPRYFSSSPGSLFSCQFRFTVDEFADDDSRPDDWIGLFPCGWKSLNQSVQQCTIGDAERSTQNSRLLLFRFSAPYDTCSNFGNPYQFLYVSAEGQVLATSNQVSFGSDPAESSGQSLISLMPSISLGPTTNSPSEPAGSFSVAYPSGTLPHFLSSDVNAATATSNQPLLVDGEVPPFDVDREFLNLTDSIDSWIPEVQLRLRTMAEGLRQSMGGSNSRLIEEITRLRLQLAQAETDKKKIRDQAERDKKEMMDQTQRNEKIMNDRILQLENENKELLGLVRLAYGDSTVLLRPHSSSIVSMSTTESSAFPLGTNNSSSSDPPFGSQTSESVSVAIQQEKEGPSPAVMPVAAAQMSHSTLGRVVFPETEQPLAVGDHQKDLQDSVSRQDAKNPAATISFPIPKTQSQQMIHPPSDGGTQIAQSPRHSSGQFSSFPASQNEHISARGHGPSEITGSAQVTSGPIQTT